MGGQVRWVWWVITQMLFFDPPYHQTYQTYQTHENHACDSTHPDLPAVVLT
jgi:hypothetical protein